MARFSYLAAMMRSLSRCRKNVPEDEATKSAISVSGSETKSRGSTGRGTWTWRFDFLMSCLGFCVGLGNIWRFPYLCYSNGGGAFLIPYLLFTVISGMPLFFFEAAIGQFSSQGMLGVWRMCPIFKGLGYGTIIVTLIADIYYNIIIAWSLYYLYQSFTSALPWSTCDNPWNTPACTIRTRNDSLFGVNYTTGLNETANGNATYFADDTNLNFTTKRTSPSEEFWVRQALQLTDGIENLGTLRWELFICSAVSWLVVCLCLIKGIKSSAKVVYVTATFPYIVLLTLLIRGVTLPGSLEGIKYYIIPDFERLLDFKVWGGAAIQVFYSNGASWGGVITFASYNKFHKDCYRTSVYVSLLNSATSIFAGFAIFAIIGYMAHEQGADVQDVVAHGPGLIFVAYPAALARLPAAPVWSVLFFLMFFSMGLDSLFGSVEAIITAIVDELPKRMRKWKPLVNCVVCAVMCVLGIPCVMQGGMYIVQVMDWYCAIITIQTLSMTELLVVSWVYGLDQFYKDITLMLGFTPSAYWKVMWGGLTPAVVLFVLLFSIIQHTPVTYGSYTYPTWVIGFGWFIATVSFVAIPTVMVKTILSSKGTLLQRVKDNLEPAPEWGPALPEHRKLYIATLSGARQRRATRDLTVKDKLVELEKV